MLWTSLREKVRLSMGREGTPNHGYPELKEREDLLPCRQRPRYRRQQKKIKGHKQQTVVDVLGLPITISIQKANIHDSVGAESVVKAMIDKFLRLKKILNDGVYCGETLSEKGKESLVGELSIVLRPDESAKKFIVIPKHWIVERSFAWLENFKRVSLDYEYFSESSLAMPQIAFTAITLKRTCPMKSK